jgi:hypothetical protein
VQKHKSISKCTGAFFNPWYHDSGLPDFSW